MNTIEPSQLLEIILSRQNHYSQHEILLNVRTFNKMIDELYGYDLSVRFGYSEFVEFVESYHEQLLYREHILHIAYTDELFNEIRHYNRIHKKIEKLI